MFVVTFIDMVGLEFELILLLLESKKRFKIVLELKMTNKIFSIAIVQLKAW